MPPKARDSTMLLKNVLDQKTTGHKQQCCPLVRQYLEIVDKCFWILHSVVPFEPKHPPVQESQAAVTEAEREKWVLEAWVCPLPTRLKQKLLLFEGTPYLFHDYVYEILLYLCLCLLSIWFSLCSKDLIQNSKEYTINTITTRSSLSCFFLGAKGQAIFFFCH